MPTLPEQVLAIDLGGTQMRVAGIDEQGNVRARSAHPTPGDDSDISALIELASGALEETGASRAVVAVPGRVDYHAGRLEHAPNLPYRWKKELSADRLTDRLGVSVVLANDADAGAVGEAHFGAARGRPDVAYVTVSTGVGAGVLLGGKLVRGRRSGAELGHVLVKPPASSEPAATIETSASGSALDEKAAEIGIRDAAALLDAVRARDEQALRIWASFVGVLGGAIANLAHLYAPDVVVVGGGVGIHAGRLLTEPLTDTVVRHGPQELPRPIEVVPAALGDDSVLVGCGNWRRALGDA